ncbi:MAG: hypothetical protein DRP45_01025 [Candidatus Zixiibacteriota bacterium]|nr:MAG: hypothetical protein DRP45_01025 [candidate division Zixibacteria bacterium]
MNKRLLHSATILALILTLVAMGTAQAKVTGKISGVVEDFETGEPVIGATVRVVGSNLITQTDEDGEYFIIGVPVGKYDLAVTHVGFKQLIRKEVRVLLDLTTPVDFAVLEVAVEMDEEMVVYASAPLIQKDLTASRITFTEERLRNLPNITTVQSVLTNYPGVVVGRDRALHVRGGRSGQVSYYYDGFSVQDPFTASAGIRIVPNSLEELSLTSGGFTAEYGEALSGVVSAVTREGGSQYRGRIRTYQGATQPYDVNTGTWGDFKSIANRSVSFDLSGPVPGLRGKRCSFFSAGEYLRDDSYLPHNWQTTYTGIAKLTAQPVQNLKVKTNVTYSESDAAVYYHRDVNGVSYDFNLDGLPLWERKAYLAGLSGNYAFSERVILSMTMNRFYTRTRSAPGHLMDTHWSEWPGYSEDEDGDYDGTIDNENYGNDADLFDPMQAVGFTVGEDFDPTYSLRESAYNSLITSVITQLNKNNQVKAGFEYRKYKVLRDFKQFYNATPYGERYSSNPIYASFFVEDKLEYADFVLNLGLRFDYRNSDISYNYTPDNETAHYKESASRSRLSPRLGMSVPISERSVVHMNYGVYYQVPRYEYLYTNIQGERRSGWPLFGNPDLEPEQTISYEIGLDHLISDRLRLDIAAYYKDISDLVTTRAEQVTVDNRDYTLTKYTNDDYGSVTGLDIALEMLPQSSHLSGSVSYGYMVAKGNGSYANEPYYTYIGSTTDSLAPISEYPLNYDQRHTVTAVLDYRVPRDWSANLFGFDVPGAWGLSMVGYYGSGLPYTKTNEDGSRLGDLNQGRLPANYTVDMRFNKDMYFGAGANMLTFFVEVDNLFNRRNVLNVYSRTGLADDDAQSAVTGFALEDQPEVERYDNLYDHDPLHYSPPRTVRTGLEFSF